MHTIWAREHNRIANKLSSLNPTWNDETIFQEARRIVIAEVQHITYNEYLPSILSPATISKYGLAPLTSGFSTNYNSSIQSGPISNEFAAAAFRMGHSMAQGVIQYLL
jgi:peroxidase